MGNPIVSLFTYFCRCKRKLKIGGDKEGSRRLKKIFARPGG
jgi:hypothetical protein